MEVHVQAKLCCPKQVTKYVAECPFNLLLGGEQQKTPTKAFWIYNCGLFDMQLVATCGAT